MNPWVNQEARVSYIGGDAETSNFSTAGLQGILKLLGVVLCGPPIQLLLLPSLIYCMISSINDIIVTMCPWICLMLCQRYHWAIDNKTQHCKTSAHCRRTKRCSQHRVTLSHDERTLPSSLLSQHIELPKKKKQKQCRSSLQSQFDTSQPAVYVCVWVQLASQISLN